MPDTYLPYRLSSQGWLTDMLLGQIYSPGHDAIRKMIYSRDFVAQTKNKLFSLHPSHKNLLEKVYLPKLSNNPSAWNLLGDITDDIWKKRYISFWKNATPAQIASMTPYIRIYIKNKTSLGLWKTRDVVFKTFADINEFLGTKLARGEGAGIKSLQLTRQYPAFGATNSFFLDLDLVFRSMPIFTKGSRGDYVKLIDPTLDSDKERLFIEYGWAFNQHNSILPEDIKVILRSEERKVFSVRWMKHDFSFEQTGEIKLKISYQGIPESRLHEKAEANKTQKNNVLAVLSEEMIGHLVHSDLDEYTKVVHKKLKEKQKEKDALAAKCPPDKEVVDCDKKKLEKLSKEISKLRRYVASDAAKWILQGLVKQRQLFEVRFQARNKKSGDSEEHHLNARILEVNGTGFQELKSVYRSSDILNQQRAEPKTKPSDLVKDEIALTDKLISKPDKEKEKIINNLLAALTNSRNVKPKSNQMFGNFLFFPLRALIAFAYMSADEEQRKRMPVTCLGNVTYRASGKVLWVNIGDILVEVGVFQRWLYKSVILSQRTTWTFGDFMKAITEELVPEILSGYSTGEYGGTNFGAITREDLSVPTDWSTGGYRKNLLKDLYAKSLESGHGHLLKSLARIIKKPEKGSKVKNPLVFYHQHASVDVRHTEAGQPPGLRKLEGRTFDRNEDEKSGMYYLHIGEDRGLLKQIKFSASDLPLLRTALMMEKNNDQTLPFLKAAYQGDASLVGNNLFVSSQSALGGFFVIPTNPLGITKEEDPGITGYYRIDKVTDTVAPGQYTTRIHGWNMFAGNKMGGKKCPEKLPDPIPWYVAHNITDYIVDDLIGIPNISKTYKIKVKELDPCPEPPEKKEKEPPKKKATPPLKPPKKKATPPKKKKKPPKKGTGNCKNPPTCVEPTVLDLRKCVCVAPFEAQVFDGNTGKPVSGPMSIVAPVYEGTNVVIGKSWKPGEGPKTTVEHLGGQSAGQSIELFTPKKGAETPPPSGISGLSEGE